MELVEQQSKGHWTSEVEQRTSASPRLRILCWSGVAGWRQTVPVLVPQRVEPMGGDDSGFTLIELMVVLLILAILLAIAIPTFLGTTSAADNRSAQSNLNTALTDAKAQFQQDGQTYYVNGVQDSAGFASLLTSAQLSLTFRAGSAGTSITQGSSGSMSNVSLAVSADGAGLVMGAFSVPGNCFYVIDNAGNLSSASMAVSPYSGTTAVTTTSTVAPAGTIGLPTSPGTSYVEVKGDTTTSDCNASTPRTSGAPATVQYLTSGFPG